jgi:hypothetical protein
VSSYGPHQVAGRREAELLPVPYFHVVFTLPPQIGGLALQNAREIYRILFRAAFRAISTCVPLPFSFCISLSPSLTPRCLDDGASQLCRSRSRRNPILVDQHI